MPPSKEIEQYDINNNLLKKWESATAAANYLNIKREGITNCCNGKLKTYKNYIWKKQIDPDLINEKWVNLTNEYDGIYISNLGRYYTKKTNKSYGSLLNNRYKIEYNNKVYQISQLVLIGFIGNKPTNKHYAKHIDGDSKNNKLYNLCWSLPNEINNNNIKTKIRLKKIIQLYNNNEIKKYESIKEASEKLNINSLCISKCAKGVSKHAGGFQWKFDDPDLIDEEWKEHPILKIQISNKGRVLAKHGKTYGYFTEYYKFNKYYVHRLVAETFLKNPENKLTVDHIDRNTKNNCIDNLRWATKKEQILNRNISK